MNYPMTSNRALRRRRFADDGPTLNPDPSTYAGEQALPYVAPALKLADTLNKGFVRQIDGIQNKAVISNLSSTGVIVGASCTWSDTDSLTLGERVLELTDLAVMESLCRGTLLPTWAGMTGARETMTAGSPEFVNFCMATVAGYSAQGVENGIWLGGMVTGQKGFVSNAGVLNSAGYNASILGAASVNETAVTTSGFTAANILANSGTNEGPFSKAYNEAVADCPAILNRPDVAFYCGNAVAGKYMQALTAAGSNQGVNLQGTNQAFDTMQYLGVPIHVCPGLPDDILVLTYEENLVVGSNLATDYVSAQYIDDWQYSGSDLVKIAMRFGCGVQVGIPGDVVVASLSTIL